MANPDDSGEKTEQPTHKKLRDAREKGEVPKSRDVTATVTLMVWLTMAALALPWVTQRLSTLIEQSIGAIHQPFSFAGPAIGWLAFEAFVLVSTLLFVPVILAALLVEFLQAGPVFTFEKIKPQLEKLDPVAGVKRMFSADQLMEVLKSVLKTALMLLIGWLVLRALLPEIALLPTGAPGHIGDAQWAVALKLLAWTLGAFAAVSVLDLLWQRYSFTKKHRMSIRDIRQEHKESEGDPHIKGQRKRLYQEWSMRNAARAASTANALVVNPTHIAIAIDYDPDTCPVPTVAAKGENEVAHAMRQAAEEAGVPILRNVDLARDLLARAYEGDVVPGDLFEMMAEVILWARQVRDHLRQHGHGAAASAADHEADHHDDLGAAIDRAAAARRRQAPGEDLTRYPEDMPEPT